MPARTRASLLTGPICRADATMGNRALCVLLMVAACFAVGANAQCNLVVQDQPQYLTSCPGDNYTCVHLADATSLLHYAMQAN